jgi:cytochrome P450
MTHTPPVADWSSDYDIFDPSYVNDPYSIWAVLRNECPIAHTERWGGSWLPTRYEDVTAIARDIEKFPSGYGIAVLPVVEVDGGSEQPMLLPYGVPPISSDPPLATAVDESATNPDL